MTMWIILCARLTLLRLAETRGRGRIPSFSTDLRQEDVDDGVQQYMDGQRCFEEFSRQKSIEDLLSLWTSVTP